MPLSQPHDLKAARKAACERDARLVYRVGRNVADDNWQQKVKDSRRAYIQDCMAKAGFTP
jgi:predicted secreted acid phosphatase